jgi:hypothetical protein
MSSFLNTNEYLSTNQSIVSDNGAYFAIMQGDGNFVVYKQDPGGKNLGAAWSAGVTRPQGDFYAIIQSDGNFVVYPGTSSSDNRGPAIWDSKSYQSGQNFTVRLHDDGILAVHEGSDQRVVWKSIRHFLRTNEILHVNEYLASDSGRYHACLLEHGDFAVYDTLADDWLWNAGANGGEGNYFACMQGDGNFVIYRGTDWSNYGPDLWSTGTRGEGQYYIYMQDDGNLALYAGTPEHTVQYLWGIGNSVMIDFDVQKSALQFPNSFCITCAQLGLPTHIGSVNLPEWANCGFCGGMCAAALNRFNRGLPAPTDTTTPAPGTPLYNELWNRQKQALAGDVMSTMLDRNMAPDKGHKLDPSHSMKYHTKLEWDKLKPRLDAGKPTILVLMVTEKDVNWDLTQNHQVLAIGYRQYQEPNGYVRIRIYDPNDPDRLHMLGMVFSWEFIDMKDETIVKKYRGFFVNSQTDAASA